MSDVVPLFRRVRRTDRDPRRSPGVPSRTGPEALWREVIGAEFRRERLARRERITDVAGRAGVSPQYLSELERGRKDPSSEMLSSVAGALDLSLLDLTRRAGRRLMSTTSTGTTRSREPLALAA